MNLGGLFESESWIVETYFRQFFIKGKTLTVRFTVRRRITKYLWNFLKTDTIYFKNDYTDERADTVNRMFGNKEARRLYLLIEMEMLKMKLNHIR